MKGLDVRSSDCVPGMVFRFLKHGSSGLRRSTSPGTKFSNCLRRGGKVGSIDMHIPIRSKACWGANLRALDRYELHPKIMDCSDLLDTFLSRSTCGLLWQRHGD
ncbi:hypothetical protein PGT21_011369 [Puccinia graminis f. sp. tritici]|uniref:Uncharacterized protein n=1 Tax=Puccinia graminis f. sp. tritici TaxID=56615 RepID=A0A5B0N1L2_PUCGR|nr:hypothetical protein PGT21_011369 [Puccinia graminis f. sp. tritici]